MARSLGFAKLALFALLTATVACGGDKSPSPASGSAHQSSAASGDIDTPAAKKLVADGALTLDVRTADEFTDGHLPTARNIPVDEIGTRLAEIEQAVGDKGRPIVVYCGTGPRAAVAKQRLEAAGFTSVFNGGGYRALSAP